MSEGSKALIEKLIDENLEMQEHVKKELAKGQNNFVIDREKLDKMYHQLVTLEAMIALTDDRTSEPDMPPE